MTFFPKEISEIIAKYTHNKYQRITDVLGYNMSFISNSQYIIGTKTLYWEIIILNDKSKYRISVTYKTYLYNNNMGRLTACPISQFTKEKDIIWEDIYIFLFFNDNSLFKEFLYLPNYSKINIKNIRKKCLLYIFDF